MTKGLVNTVEELEGLFHHVQKDEAKKKLKTGSS